MKKPVVLCIMDGFGITDRKVGNAIYLAKKPNLDYLMQTYPNTLLQASGMAVGLPEGQMGNSEVGHLNIGAGRIVYQSLTLINKAIADGSFYQNEAYLKAMQNAKEKNTNLRIFGLLSDGGVHSHINHIKALVKMAKQQGLKEVYVHAFLDGRDVEPTTAYDYISELNQTFKEVGIGKIVTIIGRSYAMDRDTNMEMIDKAYICMVNNIGHAYTDEQTFLKEQYQLLKETNRKVIDEFVEPGYNANYNIKIQDGDSIIFANFRPDRAIQISMLLTNPEFYAHPTPNDKFKAYEPKTKLKDLTYVCTMKYAESVKGIIAFKPVTLDHIFGPYIAEHGLTQLRIAETQKYAHVTFFFDGTINFDGIEKPQIPGCTRILIKSPDVISFDLKPEMSAYEVCDALLKEIDKDIHDVIIVNFANCDMVGHTAVMDATIKAVEVVDECVGKLYQKVKEKDGLLFVTADHGNADCLIDDHGLPVTSHTTNPVPFIVCKKGFQLRDGGNLGDIAPTLLHVLHLPQPKEMTGQCLIVQE